jgi:hypothetical protein
MFLKVILVIIARNITFFKPNSIKMNVSDVLLKRPNNILFYYYSLTYMMDYCLMVVLVDYRLVVLVDCRLVVLVDCRLVVLVDCRLVVLVDCRLVVLVDCRLMVVVVVVVVYRLVVVAVEDLEIMQFRQEPTSKKNSIKRTV